MSPFLEILIYFSLFLVSSSMERSFPLTTRLTFPGSTSARLNEYTSLTSLPFESLNFRLKTARWFFTPSYEKDWLYSVPPLVVVEILFAIHSRLSLREPQDLSC